MYKTSVLSASESFSWFASFAISYRSADVLPRQSTAVSAGGRLITRIRSPSFIPRNRLDTVVSLTGSSRFTTFVVLLVVGACVVTAGCASVQQSTTTGNDTGDSAHRWTVTITRIVDGDTVKFEYKNGTQDTGRLLGVDTPEVHIKNDPSEFEGVPNDSAGSSCLRDWGHKASEFANTELAEKTVTPVGRGGSC